MSSKVLIVDDDPGIQETLEAILEFEGYEVSLARDGIEALSYLEEELPGLILLDLMMPRMDGFALTQELERRGLRAALPIIVLTADGRAQEKAARLRAEDYVEKPFELSDLLDKVARLLGEQ
ncbi:MAG: response regulator [Chloroflexota bacterium]|nr:response regulator [Chloroflexota bacterium]